MALGRIPSSLIEGGEPIRLGSKLASVTYRKLHQEIGVEIYRKQEAGQGAATPAYVRVSLCQSAIAVNRDLLHCRSQLVILSY